MTRLAVSMFVIPFLFVTEVMAQSVAPVPQPSFGDILMKMLPMFIVVFVVFHFMIVRPQKNKETAHQALLKSLKNGDSVVTSSGMIGRVAGVTPEHVTLEVATGVKIRFEPSFIMKRESEEKK